MDLLTQYLENVLGLISWQLAVATPIFEELGEVDEQILQDFGDRLNDKVPPEVARQGLAAIGIYLNAMGYEYMKEQLIAAAKEVSE
jgi:hypothetical protein